MRKDYHYYENEGSSDSFVLTELIEASVLPYLGFQGGDVSLDEKAEILFAGQLYELTCILFTCLNTVVFLKFFIEVY